MAACTSCSATSSVWPRPNCKVMMETLAALVELMRARPAISPNWRSSGAVTVWPITSGLAPGYSVCTWMVGKSTCGSADSGRNLKPTMPANTIASISSEVATGRWINGADGLIVLYLSNNGRHAQTPSLGRGRCRRRCGAVVAMVVMRRRGVLRGGRRRVARGGGGAGRRRGGGRRGGGAGRVGIGRRGSGRAPLALAALAAFAAGRLIARQDDVRAVLQTVGALGDDLLAHLQAGADLDLVDGGLAARDGAQRDRLVGLE